MKQIALFLCLLGFPALAVGQDRDQRISDLERKITDAKSSVESLQKTIESLSNEVEALRPPSSRSGTVAATGSSNAVSPVSVPTKENIGSQSDETHDFASRIIGPENGGDERDNSLEEKPESFMQSRYSVAPLPDSGDAFQPNIRMSRIETRWAGRINERLGAGVEIQFQESVEGSPEKLVNDAFVEYYLTKHSTVRVGQFIRPFGFDVQHSSDMRESPERAIFSGYFFPGERDRGIMLSGDLGLDFLSGRQFEINQTDLIIKEGLKVFLSDFGSRSLCFQHRQQLRSPLLIGRHCNRPGFVRLIEKIVPKSLDLLPGGFECFVV